MHEDCYFYQENNIIYAMCVKCKEEKFPNLAAFYWDGGYGHKADVICEKCQKVIRKYDPSDDLEN